MLEDALDHGAQRLQRVINKTRFWQHHSQTVLTERQIKVLNRLLDRQSDEFPLGLSSGKYASLAKVSKATATREITDLLTKQCLVKLQGGGRSTRYDVKIVQT